MKQSYIKIKTEAEEEIYPIDICTFYSDCVTLFGGILKIPNKNWSIVEKEVKVRNCTYKQFIDFANYEYDYYNNLILKRKQWTSEQDEFKALPNLDLELIKDFEDVAFSIYEIRFAFQELTDFLNHNSELSLWFEHFFKRFPKMDIIQQVKLKNRYDALEKEYIMKSKALFPDECLSLEEWIQTKGDETPETKSNLLIINNKLK